MFNIISVIYVVQTKKYFVPGCFCTTGAVVNKETEDSRDITNLERQTD